MIAQTTIFGISLANLPRWGILLIGVVGIYTSFLLQGIAHEKLISYYHFKESLFMTLVQFISYMMFSIRYGISIILKKKQLIAPFKLYIITAISLGASMTLANVAAMNLSYPTEVLFRSSKLIPVMIGNIIFLQKWPKPMDVAAVFLIVGGLIGISLGDFKGKNKFNSVGIIAVIGSLVADAAASNLEDKTLSVYGASSDELVSTLYGVGSVMVGTLSIVTGDFASALKRIQENPSCIPYFICFGALGSVGIQFIYLIMKNFGSLTTVMMTSFRKAMTVCLSFLVYKDKKFTTYHLFSLISIASGMGLNIAEKEMSKKQEEEKDHQNLISSNSFDEIDESLNDENDDFEIQPNQVDQQYTKNDIENEISFGIKEKKSNMVWK